MCGGAYILTLLVEETGGGGLVPVGSTNSFTCPLLETPTPTPAVTPTPTATPEAIFLPNVQR